MKNWVIKSKDKRVEIGLDISCFAKLQYNKLFFGSFSPLNLARLAKESPE
jgi:hypothetical protein